MQTFILFGEFVPEMVGKISAERTTKATELLKKTGGQLKAGYALLGRPDLVIIVELPGVEEALSLSLGLSKLLGIGFTTAPALPVDELDRIAARI